MDRLRLLPVLNDGQERGAALRDRRPSGLLPCQGSPPAVDGVLGQAERAADILQLPARAAEPVDQGDALAAGGAPVVALVLLETLKPAAVVVDSLFWQWTSSGDRKALCRGWFWR